MMLIELFKTKLSFNYKIYLLSIVFTFIGIECMFIDPRNKFMIGYIF